MLSLPLAREEGPVFRKWLKRKKERKDILTDRMAAADEALEEARSTRIDQERKLRTERVSIVEHLNRIEQDNHVAGRIVQYLSGGRDA